MADGTLITAPEAVCVICGRTTAEAIAHVAAGGRVCFAACELPLVPRAQPIAVDEVKLSSRDYRREMRALDADRSAAAEDEWERTRERDR